MKKILSVVLATLLFVLAIPFSVSALSLTEGEFEYCGEDPIPLLVLVVSFDPDGDGKDAAMNGLSVMNSSLPTYGEQWAHSEASHWSKIIFGQTGNSLNNYYKEMSNGNFWWVPVEETQGTENDGIVYVTVNSKHPAAVNGAKSATGSSAERIGAINQADKYIDFSKYDKDGNGALDWTELSVLYIIAGFTTKLGYGGNGGTCAFGMGNHEANGSSTWYATCDGVKVMGPGSRYSYCGEYQKENVPSEMGSFAHELGHVLGAKDLYTYSGYTWCGGPGDIALQGGGSSLGAYKGLASCTLPAAIDPFYLIWYGFEGYTVASNGEYTLHSRESKNGDYNIIRINTEDPLEYYLIENRYTTTPSTYDAIDSGARGIQVWHVDEGIMNSYTLPNCWKGSAHAPGLTPLYPNGNTGGGQYQNWSKTTGKNFNPKNYKFAGVDTWSSRMSAEEMENYGFEIEFLSEAGNDMKIKITGLNENQPVYAKSVLGEREKDAVNVQLIITKFNNGTVTDIKFNLYKDAARTQLIKATDVQPNEKGDLMARIEGGLSEFTKYYYEFVVTSTGGVAKVNGEVSTSGTIAEKTTYKVNLYQNGPEKRAYSVTLKPGELLHYNLTMKKTGYVFCGWYWDVNFTEPYDMLYTKEDVDDINLYAKWVPVSEAASLVIKNVPEAEVFGVEVGNTFIEPVVTVKEGYKFEGWFADANLTIPFEFSQPVEEAKTYEIWAKFVPEGGVSTTTEEPIVMTTTPTTDPVVTEAPISTTTIVEASSTTEAPAPVDSSNSTVVVIVIIVVGLVLAGVAIFLIVKRKIKK